MCAAIGRMPQLTHAQDINATTLDDTLERHTGRAPGGGAAGAGARVPAKCPPAPRPVATQRATAQNVSTAMTCLNIGLHTVTHVMHQHPDTDRRPLIHSTLSCTWAPLQSSYIHTYNKTWRLVASRGVH